MFALVIAYHDAIESVLDAIAFIFVTPEFVSRDTWNKLGAKSRDTFQRSENLFGRLTEVTGRVCLSVLTVSLLYVLSSAGSRLLFGMNFDDLAQHLSDRGHPILGGGLWILSLTMVVLLLSTTLAFIIFLVLTNLSRFVIYIVVVRKLGPTLLVFGIAVFLASRLLQAGVSVEEARQGHTVERTLNSP